MMYTCTRLAIDYPFLFSSFSHGCMVGIWHRVYDLLRSLVCSCNTCIGWVQRLIPNCLGDIKNYKQTLVLIEAHHEYASGS